MRLSGQRIPGRGGLIEPLHRNRTLAACWRKHQGISVGAQQPSERRHAEVLPVRRRLAEYLQSRFILRLPIKMSVGRERHRREFPLIQSNTADQFAGKIELDPFVQVSSITRKREEPDAILRHDNATHLPVTHRGVQSFRE